MGVLNAIWWHLLMLVKWSIRKLAVPVFTGNGLRLMLVLTHPDEMIHGGDPVTCEQVLNLLVKSLVGFAKSLYNHWIIAKSKECQYKKHSLIDSWLTPVPSPFIPLHNTPNQSSAQNPWMLHIYPRSCSSLQGWSPEALACMTLQDKQCYIHGNNGG